MLMGGYFDVARTRLVQAGPASDELDHLRRGLAYSCLPPKRFVGSMNLSPSNLYPPT